MFIDHPLLGVGRENYTLYELEYVSGTSLAYQAVSIPPHDLIWKSPPNTVLSA